MRLLKNTLVLCLTIFSIFSLGFLGYGNINVEAAVTEGYYVGRCDPDNKQSCTALGGVFTGCIKIKTDFTGSDSFCTGISADPTNLPVVVWKIDNCTINNGECKNADITYTNCTPTDNPSISICREKVSAGGTTSVTLSDNGFTCSVSENNNSISISCTQGGVAQSRPPCLGFKKTDGKLGLSCTRQPILFKSSDTGTGDNQNTVDSFFTPNGIVFKTNDNKNLFIENPGAGQPNTVGKVCNNFTPFNPSGFDCDKLNNLGEFKTALAAAGVAGANSIVNVNDTANTQNQLTGCEDIDFKNLKPPQQTKAKQLLPAAKDGDIFKVCNGGSIIGIKEGENTKAIDGSGNQVTYGPNGGLLTQTVTVKSSGIVGDVANAAFDFLMKIVNAILLWFIYSLGWIAVTILYFLGQIILFFLRINPAGSGFFNVAAGPWTLLLGLTNLLILGSFIYVGVGYLLGIKSLKANLQEFLQNVVIIAITMLFTLTGTATVINITQGVGDIIIYSYALSKGGVDNNNINSALMGSVINSIGRVSKLRCGKQISKTPETKSAPVSTECDITKDPLGQIGGVTISPVIEIFSGTVGNATATLVSEALFLAMIVVAIIVFWKTSYMAVMRVVGLWLLMITSPIALATYLSPIQALKPIGEKWVNKFIKWSTFYPIFIFSLILVNLLSAQFATLDSASLLATNQGAGAFETSFFVSMQLILGAVISMGALYATTNFLDKDFENLAKGAAAFVGKYAKPAAALYGTVGRAIGGTAGAGIGNVIGRTAGAIQGSNQISKQIQNLDKKSKTPGGLNQAEKLKKQQLEEKLSNIKANTTKLTKVGKGVGDFIPNAIEFAPYAVDAVIAAPKKIGQGMERLREGRAAGFKEKYLGKLELALRGATNSQMIKEVLDGDDDLSRFVGMGKTDINQLEADAKAEGRESPLVASARDRIKDAENKAKKIVGKRLDSTIAKYLIKTLDGLDNDVKNWDKGGNSGQRKLFENLVNQAADDEGLARQLFSNKRAIGFTQQIFQDLDPTVQAKLADKEPQVQGRASDRYQAGAEFQSNPEKFKNASARAFADPDGDVIQGYKDAGGDMEELYKKIGRGYDYDSAQAASADVNVAFGGESSNPAVKGLVNTANREVGTRFIAEDDLVREQVKLRTGKLSTKDFDTDPELQKALQTTQGVDNVINFGNLNSDQQARALRHLEKQKTQKEFGADIDDPNLLQTIQGMDLATLAKTNVGQETIDELGTDYSNLPTQAEKEEVLRRVVATKAQSYVQSRAGNINRVEQASARYASGYAKGANRAKIWGIAENAIGEATKAGNWQNNGLYEKVGAAKTQSKLEGLARQGNATISSILGNSVVVDSKKDRLFIETSNENKRQRDMRKLSNAIGDFYSQDPSNPTARDDALAVFSEFGIDISLGNITNLEEKFRKVGDEFINKTYVIKEKILDPTTNTMIEEISDGDTRQRFESLEKAFEAEKDRKINDELKNAGGENFASNAGNIFGKNIFN